MRIDWENFADRVVTVAALLPDDREVKLVDMNVEPLTDAHLRWADAVFSSAMIVHNGFVEG